MSSDFPLGIAAAIIESLRGLLAVRKRAEIYFHPGIDPDAEAAVRLMYFWLRLQGCETVRIFHVGEPSRLASFEPFLPVEELAKGSLLNSDAKEAVTIVVDVSNRAFLTNGDPVLLKQLKEPDFVFDHHQPTRAILKKDAGGQCVGGELVLPQCHCTAVLIDRLIMMDLGLGNYLEQQKELAGLIVAAALTDSGLQTIDPRPDWFLESIWARLEELKKYADPTTIKRHAVEPWQDQKYLAWEKRALDEGLQIRGARGVSVAFCWGGILPGLDSVLWLSHLADVIQQRREAVQLQVPEELAFTCVMGGIESPRGLYASVRTSDKVDAARVIQTFDDKRRGGGRQRAAAVMLLQCEFPDSPSDLNQWGPAMLTKWARRTPQVLRATGNP